MAENSIQSEGGKARALALSSDRRQEIARKGANSRWTPRATHSATITLGGFEIGCANLNDGRRILIERTVASSLGRKGSGTHWKKKRESAEKGTILPEYLSFNNLAPYIPDKVRESLLNPITYLSKTGNEMQGISADLLPEICNIWLDARENNALTESQKETARRAEIILRALAKVGIIALIDEATGFQAERDRDELQRILEMYVSDEYLPWTKKFPNEYYKQLFRLRGWVYNPISVKRPQLIGFLTNKIVYKKLPHGVLDELKKKNPITPKGYRKYKFHQFLTENIGNPHLEKHLASIITLMRVAKTWGQFERMLEVAFPPSIVAQIEMELNDNQINSGDAEVRDLEASNL